MSGHALKRDGFLFKRLRIQAKKLKVFTTRELANRINTMPAIVSNNGKGEITYSKRPSKLQVTSNRLSSMLVIEPNVIKKEDRSKTRGYQTWEWIGEEEE